MKFMNQDERYNRVFREEAGEGEGGGGEGGDPVAELKAQVEALAAEKEALLNKNNELLGESKKAKELRRQAEQKATEEAKAKAEAEGNYEQLFKSSEEQRQQLASQLEELNMTVANKERNLAARQIASSLAEGENIELLSEFISKRLKFTEGEIKVTDVNGNLTVSSLDDLKNEFAGSARFASLIKGNQSSGGGASGGSSGGGAPKEITRSQFNALDPVKQKEFASLAREGKASIIE
jgi:hypothetical protein